MIVITIKFNKSNKTYDYLFENPQNLSFNINKPLKIIKDSNNEIIISEEIEVLGIKKLDVLPPHVITELSLIKDNYVKSYGMSLEKINRLSKTESPKATPDSPKKYKPLPKGKAPFGSLTAEQFVEWFGQYNKDLYNIDLLDLHLQGGKKYKK